MLISVFLFLILAYIFNQSVWTKEIGIFFIVVVISFHFQLLAGVIISFIAVMAVVGSLGNLPINFGTPGLVWSDFFIVKILLKFDQWTIWCRLVVPCPAYNSIFEVISGLNIYRDKNFEDGGGSHLVKWEVVLNYNQLGWVLWTFAAWESETGPI